MKKLIGCQGPFHREKLLARQSGHINVPQWGTQSRPSDQQQLRLFSIIFSILIHLKIKRHLATKFSKNLKKFKKNEMKLVKLKKMFPLDWNLLHGPRSVSTKKKRLTVRWAADTSRPLSAYSLRAHKKKKNNSDKRNGKSFRSAESKTDLKKKNYLMNHFHNSRTPLVDCFIILFDVLKIVKKWEKSMKKSGKMWKVMASSWMIFGEFSWILVTFFLI